MSLSKLKSHPKVLLILLAVFILAIGWFYFQSNLLKQQGDDLIKYGRAEEAIEIYKKAQRMFPLRSGISEDIEGAKLILESNRYYQQISEFQEIPSLENLPRVLLNPNELFVPILMYHHIRINPNSSDPVSAALNVSPTQLEQQLAYLSSHNFRAITLDELSDALDGKVSLPNNPVVLTFDDGYRNFYENAFPLLKKYKMKAVQFVATDLVNTQIYLTWDQIAEMNISRLIEFGAHTRHHANLPELSRDSIADEIKGSKIKLERHLRKQVNWFAYPYGSYNDFIKQTVISSGFKGAVSTIYGTIQSKDNVFLSPRIMVDGRFTLDNIARRIAR